MASPSLGLIGFDSFHFAVEKLERSRAFYRDRLDFREVARAGSELVARTGQASSVFAAGGVRVFVSTPLHEGCKAARYLRRHPAGVMSLSFRVHDLEAAVRFLDERGATFLDDPVEHREPGGGRLRWVEIATPLGDVAFRFVERTDYSSFAPGFEPVVDEAGPGNRFDIEAIDHVTSNALTIKPVVLFFQEVLGMRQFWNISFHTNDVMSGRVHEALGPTGSGLRSIVMWDPESGVKLATNEPLRPFFRQSQIAKFCYDNAGPGIQHVALRVPAIIPVVHEMRGIGVEFLATPKSYYRALPERLRRLGITNVQQPLDELERLEILLDGENDRYMLQIFLREAAGIYDDDRAGPFFYELIQRCGDDGFGYGNFRALFESIEREQMGGFGAPRPSSPPG